MAVIPIYNCFHPVLREETKNIEEFNEDVNTLITNMWDTLHNVSNGVGLAGNQVGANKSIIVIDLNREEDTGIEPVTMINPELLLESEETNELQEGCLSIPEYYENVVRSAEIKVKYYDENMKEHILDVDGFLARVMLHEIDHLRGKLFTDRITPLKRALAKSKLNKIMKGKVVPDYPMMHPDGTLTDGIEE
jgi:peptide deformylase